MLLKRIRRANKMTRLRFMAFWGGRHESRDIAFAKKAVSNWRKRNPKVDFRGL